MNDCAKFYDLISAYIDCELADDDMRLIERHISNCPNCAALLEVYREISLAAADTCAEVPEDFSAGVMHALKTRRNNTPHIEIAESPRESAKKRVTLKSMLTRYLPAAACLAVIILAAPRLSGLGCKSTMPMLNEAAMSGGGAPPPAAIEDAYESEAGQSNNAFDTTASQDDLNNDSGYVPDFIPEPFPEAPQGAPAQSESEQEERNAAESELTDSELAAKYKTEGLFAVIVVRGTLPETFEFYGNGDAGGGVLTLLITRETALALMDMDYYSEVIDENSLEAIIIYLP